MQAYAEQHQCHFMSEIINCNSYQLLFIKFVHKIRTFFVLKLNVKLKLLI